jgi:hypothetical protein
MVGTVWCRNTEGKTKRIKRLGESNFSRLQIGSRIILRDDGWFDKGNNFVRVLGEGL